MCALRLPNPTIGPITLTYMGDASPRPCDRVLRLLGPQGRRRRYVLPAGWPIQDEYTLSDGITYRVVAVERVNCAPSIPDAP